MLLIHKIKNFFLKRVFLEFLCAWGSVERHFEIKYLVRIPWSLELGPLIGLVWLTGYLSSWSCLPPFYHVILILIYINLDESLSDSPNIWLIDHQSHIAENLHLKDKYYCELYRPGHRTSGRPGPSKSRTPWAATGLCVQFREKFGQSFFIGFSFSKYKYNDLD